MHLWDKLIGAKAASADAGQQAVRAFFDEHAENYSCFFNTETPTGGAELFRTRMALCVAMLADRSGALIDCASGTGEITRAVALSSNWTQIYINDLSPSMIKRCRDVMSDVPATARVSWNVGSVFDLSKDRIGGTFDVALCLGLIAHCGRLPQLLQIVHELLKSGGVLLLQSSLLDHPGYFVTKFVSRFRRGYAVEGFYLRDILTQANRAGFEPVAIKRFGLCLPFGDRILGRLNYWLERKLALRLSNKGGDVLILLRKR
jgi:ubiquinone/menaquinone biosynthesis C-methylase UbiE